GLIVPHLDELVDLPSRLEIEAGLRDVVARIADLLNEPHRIRDSLRVSCKKLGGMISLAIHTGNSDLLESTADSLADKILWPLAEGYD
ncbi:hypothetical protein, partial [Klebsiella aerogenes]|uniref:hypothetical protein n=1 Tax=Klebsiella aerogenes TaxID=548 RepID=UPI001952E56B